MNVMRWSVALFPLLTLLFGACHKKEEPPPASPGSAEVTQPDSTASAPVEVPAASPESAPPDALAAQADPAGGDQAYEAWFKKYHLDLNDPKMLDDDPDHDGFSNRDEFMADTSPLDPNARPGIHKTIHLKDYTEVRLPVILEGVDGNQARIKRLDGQERVEVVKEGDSLKGLGLKVRKVQSQTKIDKHGETVDVSSVTLDDPATNESTHLVKDLPSKTGSSFATLVSDDGQTAMKVKEGQKFQWPGDPGTTYKVIDLRTDQVVLQEVETKKMWTIPKQ